MLVRLLLIGVLAIAVEWSVLLFASSKLGWELVATIVLATAVIGACFMRYHGARIVKQIRNALSRGEMPANDIASGFLLLISAVLLMVPGFLTDAVGLLLLIPAIRTRVSQQFRRRIAGRLVPVTLGGPAPFVDIDSHEDRYPHDQSVDVEVSIVSPPSLG